MLTHINTLTLIGPMYFRWQDINNGSHELLDEENVIIAKILTE